MKILLTLELEPRLVGRITSAVDGVEILQARSEEEALEMMPEADVLLGSFSPALYRRSERLRWVQSWGAGVNGMLFKEFVESEIVLTSAKGTVGVHLAEHAMALLLSITRSIATAIRESKWDGRMPQRHAMWELIDRTMGIVGLGGTGRELAVRAAGFGMRVIAVDPDGVDVPDCVESCWGMDAFHTLLSESDVVSICAPLTPQSENLFDEAAFDAMRDHAILVNVTRGGIVEEDALLNALRNGSIGGAGLDVTPQEPLSDDHPLWSMPNVVVTPHTAGGSPNRDDRLVDLICENLRRLDAGEPLLSQIDKRKGY